MKIDSLVQRITVLRRAAFWALLLVCPPWGSTQQPWTPSQSGSYALTIQATLNKLNSLRAELNGGNNAATVQSLMNAMAADVRGLGDTVKSFREKANRESQACTNNVEVLDRNIGFIAEQQTELKEKIQNAQARIAEVQATQQLSESDKAALLKNIEATNQQLQQRNAKLQELTTWWWVPGYGAYLSIRTLVDDDITRSARLQGDLAGYNAQLANQNQALEQLKKIYLALQQTEDEMSRTGNELKTLQDGAEAELNRLHHLQTFFGDADIFWAGLESMINAKITPDQNLLQGLITLLNKKTYIPGSQGPSVQDVDLPAASLYDALTAFGTTLDGNKQYLAADTNKFCGGPPPALVVPNVDPPGCPPPQIKVAREPVVSARGQWSRVANQNWIGGARCQSPSAMYYGKKESADACEAACKADIDCASWTYNESNAHLQGTIHECWGGRKTLVPTKMTWLGYISGGANWMNRPK